LILYEPPLQDRIDLGVAARMEELIHKGEREQGLIIFLQEAVMVSPSEVSAMRSRPSWSGLVATIDSQPRQMRALASYRFDAMRISTVTVPTLLITGSDTASPQLKQAITSLQASLPNSKLAVLEGQEHNAMDSAREMLGRCDCKFPTQ
jgi:pimeloyl-ACP methyl ester carboxylesterase